MLYWELTITTKEGVRGMFLVESPSGAEAIRRFLDENPTMAFVNLKIEKREFEGIYLQ